MRSLVCALLLTLAQSSLADNLLASPHTYAFCTVADLASTYHVVESGKGQEVNPLFKDSVNEGNYTPIVSANLLGIAAIYYLAPKASPKALIFANVVRCLIAGNNIRIAF